MNYLSNEQFRKIVRGYSLFQVPSIPTYQGPSEFAKRLQRVSNLQFEELRFFTSDSALAPKSNDCAELESDEATFDAPID